MFITWHISLNLLHVYELKKDIFHTSPDPTIEGKESMII